MSNVDLNNPVVVNPIVTSMIRKVLTVIGTALAAKGVPWIGDNINLAVGVVMVLISVGWSIYASTRAKMIDTTSKLKNVDKIVTDAATAEGALVNNPKVVAVEKVKVVPVGKL